MEDSIISRIIAEELKNGLPEPQVPNGDRDTLLTCNLEQASVDFDAITSNSNGNDEDCDSLSNGTSNGNHPKILESVFEAFQRQESGHNMEENFYDKEHIDEDVQDNEIDGNFYEIKDIEIDQADESGVIATPGENSELEDVSVNNYHDDMEDVHEQTEESINLVVTTEEPEQPDIPELESATGLGTLTISNVFTDTASVAQSPNDVDVEIIDESSTGSKSRRGKYYSIERSTRKIIKSIVKQTRSFTSPEYIWLIIQLTAQSSDHTSQILKLIDKRVSEEAKQNIKKLLKRTKSFNSDEHDALLQKLDCSRTNSKPNKCRKDFSQSIMWFKTHLEIEPDHVVNKTELFTEYNSYCVGRDLKALKCTEFISLLRNIYPLVRERRPDSKGIKRYVYAHIKFRRALHPPKLPKFATDQLHNNVLLAQYMSCHGCCSLYSIFTLEKPAHPGRPKLKLKSQGHQSNKRTAATIDSQIHKSSVEDPLQLLNVAPKETHTEVPKQEIIEIVDLSNEPERRRPVRVKVQQVAKKSVFSKRIKRIPSKYRDNTPTVNHVSSSSSKINSAPTDYTDKLFRMNDQLSRFVITKVESCSKYKVACTCCPDVFFITEQHFQDIQSARDRLLEVLKNPKRLSKTKRNHHSSVQRLYYKYNSIILPETVVHSNIDPTININRFGVYDWFKNEIANLKRRLLDSAVSALQTNRRGRYEPRVPNTTPYIISHTPTQITPPHPPIYISALPPEPKKAEAPKIAEVYIKAEGPAPGRKRQSSEEPEVIEISAQKKSKPHSSSLNTVYSRNRHMPYNKRKEADFIYFPAIDTSQANLRLANLGTLYRCILCLMLFNTEQKLLDHEKAHLTCHKCQRKLRTVELMRQHLIKHCERNYRKRKPIIKIHKVDSIAIMVKKYGETFELSKTYYKELHRIKPKKKYREMVRPKVELIPEAPVIEEVFISDVKPNVNLLNEQISDRNQSNNKERLLDVKPQSSSIPGVDEAPTDNHTKQEPGIINNQFTIIPVIVSNFYTEPPSLIPLPSTSTSSKKKNVNKRSSSPSTRRSFKIRVKDLIELS